MKKSGRGRRRTRNVVMPPTLRYRSASSSHSRGSKRKSSRLRMRPWLEGLLDREECSILHWECKGMRTFSIAWRHASSHGFDQSQHGDLFYMWAQHTGKLTKNNHGDHSNNKSTFRCALHSLKDCIELTKKGDKRGEGAKRTYQFIDPGHHLYDKKRKTASQIRKKAQHVDENDGYSLEIENPTTDELDYASVEPESPVTNSRPFSPEAINIHSITLCSTRNDVKDHQPVASTSSTVASASLNLDNSYAFDISGQDLYNSGLQTFVPVSADGSQLYSETECLAGTLLTLHRYATDDAGAFSDCKQEPNTQDIHNEENQYQAFKTMENQYTCEATSSISIPKLNCGGKVKIKVEDEDNQPEMIDCSLIQTLLEQYQHKVPDMDNEFSEEIASDVIIETDEMTAEEEITGENFLPQNQEKRVLTEVQPLLHDQSFAAMEAESSFDSLSSYLQPDIFSMGTF